MQREIVYSSYAAPPVGISVSGHYRLDKDAKGYFVIAGKEKHYFDIEFIKAAFKPVDGEWDVPEKVAAPKAK